MFVSVLKKTIWIVYDNLSVILWSSFVWSIFNIPVFGFFFYLLFVVKRHTVFAIVLFSSLLTSPLSAALVKQAGFMMEDSIKSRKISEFVKGFLNNFFSSFFLCIVDSTIIWLLIKIMIFWLSPPFQIWRPVCFVFAGLVFWIIALYSLMRLFFLPLLVIKKERLRDTFKKSFLIILAKPFFIFKNFFFILFLGIIMFFTGVGLFIFYPAFLMVFLSVLTFKILSLYNPSIRFEEEKRSWRTLFRPWE